MKRLVVCLVVICTAAFALHAAESDVILRARNDAWEDGQKYHPYWWSIGGAVITAMPVVLAAFAADALPVEQRRLIALTAPVAGGAGLALVGYLAGSAGVSDARIAEIQKEYADPTLISLYRSEYEKALSKMQRNRRGNYALIGSGVSIGVMGLGFLVVYLAK